MDSIRIIPRLDIKGPNLVKGIHLEGLRVLGCPAAFAKHYYEQGADELFYQDVVASLFERNSLLHLVSETAKELFIPLTVGGGIRSVDDISAALGAGADKIAINTAATRTPELITQAAQKFGSSTVVVAIEAIRQDSGDYLAHTDNGRELTDLEVVNWARKAEKLGAGEILLTSVDKEGTGEGFNIELVKAVCQSVSIPVIIHGGPGKAADIIDGVVQGGADAVAIASLLHYHTLNQIDDSSSGKISARQEGNMEFLKQKKIPKHFEPVGLVALKNYLLQNQVTCRPPEITK
ncbi:imidazole glycerol phosphate synthase subunit HisF [Neorhodopirellula lusitana]|uniref:imidazole glycerol phosphate synthase subunit HisF n=1 Tax=Neorhodopirellula lusitana TaxID=445327 RepID=UPI00384A7DA6